jgi:hypothetical protein
MLGYRRSRSYSSIPHTILLAGELAKKGELGCRRIVAAEYRIAAGILLVIFCTVF